MSGGISAYALAYPTRGIVLVDNGPEIRPFAELLHRLEPVLRSPGFADAWPQFEASLGLDRIPEPVHSLVLDTHDVTQDVVVGYWEPLLQADPTELQELIDARMSRLETCPASRSSADRWSTVSDERFERLPDVQLEEWTGEGHFVHLVDPDRFATRLEKFVAYCAAHGLTPDASRRASQRRLGQLPGQVTCLSARWPRWKHLNTRQHERPPGDRPEVRRRDGGGAPDGRVPTLQHLGSRRLTVARSTRPRAIRPTGRDVVRLGCRRSWRERPMAAGIGPSRAMPS